MNTLREKYRKEVAPALVKKFKLRNVLEAPRLVKIVISVGLGEGAQDEGLIKGMTPELEVITGQKPKVTRAKRANSDFKIKAGDPIGLMVTLRGERMYDFLEKLLKIVLPRVRDFRGVSLESFDGRGNYNLGLVEQTVFPEIDYDKVTKTKGLQITIVTSGNDDEKARALLKALGMPFEKHEEARKRRG